MTTGRGSRQLRAATSLLAAILLSLAIPLVARAAAPTPSELLSPPSQHSQPVRVGLALRIINIASIDEVNERFEIDGFLLAGWTDPRLSYTATSRSEKYRDYAKGEVWIPYFEMVNGVSPHDRYDISIQGSPDGAIRYAERFHALLSCKFLLKRFPFDSQSLLIIIHPFVRQSEEVAFFLSDRDVGASREFAEYSSLAQWNVKGIDSWAGTTQLYDHHESAEARFTIKVKRRFDFYIWKVMLPLLLMVILSWSVFWVEARELSSQVQIAVTTILTVIAFAFAISSDMPRVPYLTYIDAFFLTCYVFVFLSMMELMAVHLSHRRNRATDLGVRIQRISRWAIPAAFVATNLILMKHFLG